MAKVTLTRTKQHTIIGQGLALGCLAVGIEGLSANPLTLERAFRYAWVRWEYSRGFPAVHAGPRFDDICMILERSPGRTGKPVAAFRREPGWGFVPYLKNETHTVAEAAEQLEELTGIPLTAWRALAELTASGLV